MSGPGRLANLWPVRTTVKVLRRKLGDDADNPTYILTELRVGYRMAKGETQEQEDGLSQMRQAQDAGISGCPFLIGLLIIFPCLSYSYPTAST